MGKSQKPMKLGDILVQKGVLSQGHLDSALEIGKQSNARIGDILVQNKFCTQDQIMDALSEQLGIPIFDFTKDHFDQQLVGKIDSIKVSELQAFPLYFSGKDLVVAMVDPLNSQVEENYRHVFRCDTVISRIISMEDLNKLIRDHLGLAAKVQSLIDRIAHEEASDDIRDTMRSDHMSLADLKDQAPTVHLEYSIVEDAVRRGASDIHINYFEDGSIAILNRVDGELEKVLVIHDSAVARRLVARFKVAAGTESHKFREKQEGRMSYVVDGRNIDARFVAHPTEVRDTKVEAQMVVIRLLVQSNTTLHLDDLGFSPTNIELVQGLVRQPHGIIYLVGPTGSGKTTTLAAILQSLNTGYKNIITVEDPVEYYIPGINQIRVDQRADITFSNVIRGLLRSDPDTMMIGETRDRATAEAAAQAANTGHLVFTTLHANESAAVFARLFELGVPAYLINNTTLGILAQRLLPILCPKCRVPLDVNSEEYSRQFGEMAGAYDPMQYPAPKIYRNARSGCTACEFKGFRGRTAAVEVLTVNNALRELIENTLSIQRIKQAARREGMRTIWEDSVAKVLAGVTSLDEVKKVIKPDESLD